ncbi:MAG: cytochrome c [Desulfobacterales bacterium]
MVSRKRILILGGVFLFSALMMLVSNHQVLSAVEDEEQLATGPGDLSPAPADEHPPAKALLLPRKRVSPLTREARKGKALYEYYCALCHGLSGDADGFNAYGLRTLGTPPAKHSDPSYMLTLSDTYIGDVIRVGGRENGRSPLMPPWGGVLNDDEITDLISFLRTLAQPGSKVGS